MITEQIGDVIARLRKEKGSTQEELAKYVLVSTQAVSKWENGGVPDTELLPKIADFFSVSVDTLFGRSLTDYSDIEHALAKKLADTPRKERFETAFELCWLVECAMFGEEDRSIKDIRKKEGNNRVYSSIRSDEGFTLMGLSAKLPYFLLVPECGDKNTAYFEGIDYPALFRDFSDKTVFDAMVYLNTREHGKGFTPNLLVKKFGIDAEKAMDVIKTLKKYGVIRATQIEMDDVTQEVFTFEPTPSFAAMLIFAREMIEKPNGYYYYSGGRQKPYFA